MGLETLDLNAHPEERRRVEIKQAIVGEESDIFGESTENRVNPKIGETDVLILDCEGSEISILSNMKIEPRTIICENHPQFGASSSKIVDILEARNYKTTE